MDTFIDKLAQKRNAQEMIRANSTAEAVKLEQLENQMAAYDGVMQEIRRVNLRTAENAVRAQDVLKECMEKIEVLQETEKTGENAEQTLLELNELKGKLEELFKESGELLHRENVKVYRNVQASLAEELGKQTQELKGVMEQEVRGIMAFEPKTNKPLTVMTVLILIGVVANLVLQILTNMNFGLF